MLNAIKEWLGIASYNSIVVYPPEEGGIKKETIKDPPGQPYRYKGKLVHLLVARNGTNNEDEEHEWKYEAYEPLTMAPRLGISPFKLGRARYCDAAMRLWRHKKHLYEKIAVWGLVAAIAIGGILLFLMQGRVG